MNPLTKVKLINELNEREAHLGIKDTVSWHSEYKDSAWIFIGGFPYELTEGDIVCVFSQYGEIANINLVRDKKTGKSKGFCFLCYEDQRSTILAVDNLNGIKIKGRTLRVDHVANYRPPKDSEDIDDITKRLREEGCAPKLPSSPESESEDEHLLPIKKPKKDKKEKKKKKKEKKEKKKEAKAERRAAQTDPSHPTAGASVKKEKEDAGYEKYALKGAPETKSSRERSAEDQRRGERDRERDERRTGAGRDGDEARGKDEQSARENRERERWKERQRERDGDRERDRNGDRERDRDRNNRDRDREKWRDREYRRN